MCINIHKRCIDREMENLPLDLKLEVSATRLPHHSQIDRQLLLPLQLTLKYYRTVTSQWPFRNIIWVDRSRVMEHSDTFTSDSNNFCQGSHLKHYDQLRVSRSLLYLLYWYSTYVTDGRRGDIGILFSL